MPQDNIVLGDNMPWHNVPQDNVLTICPGWQQVQVENIPLIVNVFDSLRFFQNGQSALGEALEVYK